jgi:hypothetical protein
MSRKWMSFLIAPWLAVAASAALGQVIPQLPPIAEGPEARENCLGLLAVLPVIRHPKMQELSRSDDLYGPRGNAMAVNAVVGLAQQGEADALFALGMLFESGNCFVGTTPDPKNAQALHREAAARGSREAKAHVRP